MEDNKKPQIQQIDVAEILQKLWNNKRLIIKSCVVSAIIGIIIAISIPKEYTTTVTLASEVTKNSMNSSVSVLASMAGINMGGSNDRDALSPLVYPEVVSSTAFAIELFDIPVSSIDGEINTTLKDYLLNNQKSAWWSSIFGIPSKVLGFIKSLFEKKSDSTDKQEINPFRLTKGESATVGSLRSKIRVEVDKKTAVITLNVTMQDPLISATVADTVMTKLQQHITKYRTSKATVDLEFAQKIYDESKKEYYEAQQKYAEYVDRNQNIPLRSVQTYQERLENEMRLTYSVYTQSAQQLQLAKAKLQENTPIYAEIQPATVPLVPSKPSKMIIVVGFMFLAFALSCMWILYGQDILNMKSKK